MATNVVLAGRMEGGEVMLSAGAKSAYIIKGPQTKYINKLEVEEVTEVNRSANNGVLTRGSAITSISEAEIMLEIRWKDGATSLVKVDKTVHQAIIVGMYNNITEEQQTQIAKKDTSTRQTNTTIGWILFIACSLFYLFTQISK